MQTIDKEQARQGQTTSRMRSVLATSLAGSLLAMAVVGFTFVT